MFRTAFLIFLGGIFLSQASCIKKTFWSIDQVPTYSVTFEVANRDSDLFFQSNSEISLKISISKVEDASAIEELANPWNEVFRSIQIYKGKGCKGRPIKLLNGVSKQKQSHTVSLPNLKEGIYSFKLLTRFEEDISEDVSAEGEEGGEEKEEYEPDVLEMSECSEPISVDINPPEGVIGFTSTAWGDIPANFSNLDLAWKSSKEKGRVQSGVAAYDLKVYPSSGCQGEPVLNRKVSKPSTILPLKPLKVGTTYSFSVNPKDKAGHQGKTPTCSKRTIRRVPLVCDPTLPQVEARSTRAHEVEQRICVKRGLGWGPWTKTGCVLNYHEEASACVPNTRSCPGNLNNPMPPGAITAEQIWSSTWLPCIATACNTRTYILHSGNCYAKSASCTSGELARISPNALLGTKTYDKNTLRYSSCQLSACKDGYVKKNGGCHVPSANGKYADAYGAEKDCVVDGNLALPNGAAFVTRTGGRTMTESCDFTCSAGQIKYSVGNTRRCDDPGLGVYVVGGVGYNCWPLNSDSSSELTNRGGASGWVNPQPTTVTAAADCQLVGCTANDKVLNATKTQCVNLPDRHYKDPATQQAVSCGTVHASVSANSANGGGWATNQVGVTEQGDCKIECGSGSGSGHHPARLGAGTGETAQCEQECSLGSTPNFGYASENSGRIAWDSSKRGGAGWSATCTAVVCNEGYDDDDDDNTCVQTEAGYYSAGQNRKTRTQCTLDGATTQAYTKGWMLLGRGQDLSMQLLVDGPVIQDTISVVIPPPVPAMIAPVKSMMALGKEPATAVPVR